MTDGYEAGERRLHAAIPDKIKQRQPFSQTAKALPSILHIGFPLT
jgi:hypothetical protein